MPKIKVKKKKKKVRIKVKKKAKVKIKIRRKKGKKTAKVPAGPDLSVWPSLPDNDVTRAAHRYITQWSQERSRKLLEPRALAIITDGESLRSSWTFIQDPKERVAEATSYLLATLVAYHLQFLLYKEHGEHLPLKLSRRYWSSRTLAINAMVETGAAFEEIQNGELRERVTTRERFAVLNEQADAERRDPEGTVQAIRAQAEELASKLVEKVEVAATLTDGSNELTVDVVHRKLGRRARSEFSRVMSSGFKFRTFRIRSIEPTSTGTRLTFKVLGKRAQGGEGKMAAKKKAKKAVEKAERGPNIREYCAERWAPRGAWAKSRLSDARIIKELLRVFPGSKSIEACKKAENVNMLRNGYNSGRFTEKTPKVQAVRFDAKKGAVKKGKKDKKIRIKVRKK